MKRLGRVLFWVLAIAIVAAGAAIRLPDLETNPPGLWQDEASTGVDAHLLWTTGRDRAGVRLPIIARSLGDYPLTLYRYLDAPIVGWFGLSAKTERIVAAVTGALLVPLAGLLAARVFGPVAAIGTMASSAFAPTWIQFSRYGSEAILLPFFLTLGTWLFEVGRNPRKRWALWAGAIAIALSAYTYHAVKIFLPVWMIGFLLRHRRTIVRLWRTSKPHLFGPAVIFTLLVLPSVYAATTPEGQARGAVMAWRHFQGFELVRVMLAHFLSYFDARMLFVIGGPHTAQSIPGAGLWSLIDLPLILIGLAACVRNPFSRPFRAFLFFWFLIGPLPGGLSHEAQNVGRVIGWLPAPQILSGLGFAVLVRRALAAALSPRVGTGRARMAVVRPLAIFFVVLIGVAWAKTGMQIARLTLVEYRKTSGSWQYEVSAAMRCALQHRHKNEHIVVSPRLHHASEVFAMFHFASLPALPDGRKPWSFGERTQVPDGELYIAPAGGAAPSARRLCSIRYPEGGRTLAYVYGSVGPGAPSDPGVPP